MKNANGKNVKKKQNEIKKKDKSQQKNKNLKKKKDNAKPTIDSPFVLDLPSIDNENNSKVVSCFRQSVKDYLCTLEKTKECEENTKLTSVKVNKKKIKKNPLSKVHPACIIFGFNSVMKNLENKNIKIIFVNPGTEPTMLIKCFIPICNLQSIPLITVKNLSEMFVNVGIRSTIAVGITLAGCEKKGPFHNLYIRCCKVFGYNYNIEDLPSSKETSEPKENIRDHIKGIKETKSNLITNYHLSRTNRKIRVFKPPKSENPSDESFIKLDNDKSLMLSANFDSKRNNKRKAADAFKKKSTSDTKETLPEIPEQSFYIDVNSDDIELNKLEEHDLKEQSDDDDKPVKKRATARYFDALNKSTGSNSKKKANYIPAKIRKIKASLKRHP